MSIPKDNLAERIKAGRISLEDALLIIGGCGSESSIRDYKSKIAALADGFYSANPLLTDIAENKGKGVAFERQVEIGKALFNYLWRGWTKESRYVHDTTSSSSNQLPQVVDYQLNPARSKPIGNCQGLTMLYAMVGLRAGLELQMGKLNWQDIGKKPQGEHTFCALKEGERKVLVENTAKDGFDWDMSKYNERYEPSNIWFADINALAAVAFSERGYLRSKQGDLEAALSDYDCALSILPQYNLVVLKRGRIKERLGDLQGAAADYEEAIRQNPYWSVPRYHLDRLR